MRERFPSTLPEFDDREVQENANAGIEENVSLGSLARSFGLQASVVFTIAESNI